jgi:hypothetical protein
MTTFGRQVIGVASGRPVAVSADGAPESKMGGVTVDWSTVTAAGSDTLWPDGTTVLTGQKALRFGQILAQITQREVQTVTVSGTPTGGNTVLGVVIAGVSHTVTVPYNATATSAQALFDTALGTNVATVSGGALPGTALTVTFNVSENVATMTHTDAYTGGSSPAAAIATSTQGTASRGSYGPYDPAATDGRQTLSRGACYILDETVFEHSQVGFDVAPSDHPAVIEGGLCWKARLLMTTGTHSLAAGPTVSEVEAAFPRVRYAQV